MSKNHIGDNFQEQTRYARDKVPPGQFKHIQRPALYKNYPEAKQIALPKAVPEEGKGIWNTVAQRRSVRNFSDESMSLEGLSRLLWATQGITATREELSLRASPSAGALYPVESYVVVNNIDTLEKGIYHYNVRDHALEFLKKGDFGWEVGKAALNQDICAEAQVVFIWTAIFDRSKWKYKQRAYRYVYLDMGHICAQLTLAAVGLDLGSCPIAAFFDHDMDQLLGVDGKKEGTLYLCAVGKEQK